MMKKILVLVFVMFFLVGFAVAQTCDDDDVETDTYEEKDGINPFDNQLITVYDKDGNIIESDEDGACLTQYKLYESYCNENNEIRVEEIRCDELFGMACHEGKCKEILSCDDPDKDDPNTKGLTTFVLDKGSKVKIDECLAGTLYEYTCQDNYLIETNVDCGFEHNKECLDGRCVTPKCYDNSHDFGNKGISYITDENNKIIVQEEDYCLNHPNKILGENSPNELIKPYCETPESYRLKQSTIDCRKDFNKGCIKGACVDIVSCTINKDAFLPYAPSSITVNYGNGQSRKFIDYCFNDAIEHYYCDGLFPMKQTKESCPVGLACSNGRCGVVDSDGDGVMDRKDNCDDTMMGDSVNEIGCSCYQQKIKLVENRYVNFGFEKKDCEDLETKEIPCGKNSHCCNGIFDGPDLELLPDCGLECDPCDTQCVEVVSGGDYSLLLVPIDYTSSQQNSRLNNKNDWKFRAGRDALYISTTPPFCESADFETVLESPAGKSFIDETKCDGNLIDNENYPSFGSIDIFEGKEFNPIVSIYRLDVFGIAPDPSLQYTMGLDNFEEYVIKKIPEYTSFCSGVDHVSFLIPSEGTGFATNVGTGFNYVYGNEPERNIIVHELGHSLCGLEDEYVPERSTYDENLINCDTYPVVETDSEGNEQYLCK